MSFFLLLAAARGLDNGVGLTPAMGVNTYQSPWPFQGGFAPAIADALTALGMKDKGYVYVNSDAGWQPKSPGRDSSGAPVPDQGCPMPETATALAAKGFRMGLYSALSSVQCGGAPGGLYHEDLDAAAYKEWGLKYLKYDNCAEYALEPNARSSPMRDALNRTGTPILFSIEPFDLTPNPQAHIANLWRTTTDVSASTEKVRVNADLNDKVTSHTFVNDSERDRYCFNDSYTVTLTIYYDLTVVSLYYFCSGQSSRDREASMIQTCCSAGKGNRV